MNEKKKTCYTNSRIYYNKIYFRMTSEESEKITEYCEKNNISKSYFMALATSYYIDNDKKKQ